MGLFSRGKKKRTPDEIEGERERVRAHIAKVDAARLAKLAASDTEDVVVAGQVERLAGAVAGDEAAMIGVNGSGSWEYQRVLGSTPRVVTATLKLLRNTRVPEVSVYVGGRKVGWLNDKNSARIGAHLAKFAPDGRVAQVRGVVAVHSNGVETFASLLVEDPTRAGE